MADGLDIRCVRSDGVVCVRPRGEIDTATCGQLGDVLRRVAREEDAADVVVDLTEVGFMDSSGLSVLLNAHRRLTRAARRLRLVVPDGQVARLLRTAHLETTFAVHPTRRDALRAAGG